MKLRLVASLALAIVFLSALAFADGKGNCTDKNTSSSKASCCPAMTKASLKSDAKSDCKMDAKECTAKNAKMSGECSMSKGSCDMAKTTKASMKKAGGAMDCCKTKATEAKDTKSNQTKSTESKGTN